MQPGRKRLPVGHHCRHLLAQRRRFLVPGRLLLFHEQRGLFGGQGLDLVVPGAQHLFEDRQPGQVLLGVGELFFHRPQLVLDFAQLGDLPGDVGHALELQCRLFRIQALDLRLFVGQVGLELFDLVAHLVFHGLRLLVDMLPHRLQRRVDTVEFLIQGSGRLPLVPPPPHPQQQKGQHHPHPRGSGEQQRARGRGRPLLPAGRRGRGQALTHLRRRPQRFPVPAQVEILVTRRLPEIGKGAQRGRGGGRHRRAGGHCLAAVKACEQGPARRRRRIVIAGGETADIATLPAVFTGDHGLLVHGDGVEIDEAGVTGGVFRQQNVPGCLKVARTEVQEPDSGRRHLAPPKTIHHHHRGAADFKIFGKVVEITVVEHDAAVGAETAQGLVGAVNKDPVAGAVGFLVEGVWIIEMKGLGAEDGDLAVDVFLGDEVDALRRLLVTLDLLAALVLAGDRGVFRHHMQAAVVAQDPKALAVLLHQDQGDGPGREKDPQIEIEQRRPLHRLHKRGRRGRRVQTNRGRHQPTERSFANYRHRHHTRS